LLENITIFSTIAGSSSESPSGDSFADSMALRAFDDFPLDGKAINFGFLADSRLFRPISCTLRELIRSSTLRVFKSLASSIAITLGLHLIGKLLRILVT